MHRGKMLHGKAGRGHKVKQNIHTLQRGARNHHRGKARK